MYEYLDIDLEDVGELRHYLYTIRSSEENRNKEKFKLGFNKFLELIEITDKNIYSRLNRLNRIECFRMNEAMKCLNMNANLACVVMAVSAVEHRLLNLIKKKNKKLYESEFKKSTLGGIIELFRKDSRCKDKKYDRLKKILPSKHRHLMEILNTYRVFSAHPKDEVITNQTAKAILSFSFLLLIDENLKI